MKNTFKYILCLALSIMVVSCSSSSKKAATPADKKAKLFYGQGTRDLVNKDFTQALKNLLQANLYKPNQTKILNNLGMAYYFKKDKGLAMKHLKQSIKSDPKNSDARINIATIYMEIGSLGKAEEQYKIVAKDLLYESQDKTYFNLGMLSLKQNKTTQGINYFKQSINVNESYCPSHLKLGKVEFKRANYRAAIKYFKEANNGLCYNNPQPTYHQALTYIELGEYNKARIKLDDVLERFPMDRYASLARRKMLGLSKLSKKDQQLSNKKFSKSIKSTKTDRNIFSPNF